MNRGERDLRQRERADADSPGQAARELAVSGAIRDSSRVAVSSGSRPTLYESVLGDRFASLPPALRRFHGHRGVGRARGSLQVSRGRGLLARFVAWFIDAPPAGEQVPVELRVEVEGEREVWTRSFAGHVMVTRQWRAGRHLVEAAGPSQVRFELDADQEGIVFVQRGVKMLGVPLPPVLAPRVSARESAGAAALAADGWELHVSISFPIIGTVVEYTGALTVDG